MVSLPSCLSSTSSILLNYPSIYSLFSLIALKALRKKKPTSVNHTNSSSKTRNKEKEEHYGYCFKKQLSVLCAAPKEYVTLHIHTTRRQHLIRGKLRGPSIGGLLSLVWRVAFRQAETVKGSSHCTRLCGETQVKKRFPLQFLKNERPGISSLFLHFFRNSLEQKNGLDRKSLHYFFLKLLQICSLWWHWFIDSATIPVLQFFISGGERLPSSSYFHRSLPAFASSTGIVQPRGIYRYF